MKYLNSFQSFDKIMEKAEVKYSQTALNQIMDLIKKYDEKSSIFKNRKSLLQELGFVFDEKGNPKIKIQVPLKEIVYSESPKIQLGLVIFGILSSFQNELIEIEKNHIDKKKWEGLDRDTYRICKTIFKHWIETKKIHPLGRQIITKILHEGEIEYNFILKSHDGDGHYNYHRSEIAIGKAERNTDEKKMARHELQHLTQYVNTNLINLAKIFQSGYGQVLANLDELLLLEISPIDSIRKLIEPAKKIANELFLRNLDIDLLENIIEKYARVDHLQIFFYFLKFLEILSEKKTYNQEPYIGVGKTRTDYDYLYHNHTIYSARHNNYTLISQIGAELSLSLTALLGIKVGTHGINYFGSDVEYHPWLSNTLDDFTTVEPFTTIIRNNDVDKAFEKISKAMKSSSHYRLMKNTRKEAETDFLKLLKQRIINIKNSKN